MINISRRSLAKFAADQLLIGQPLHKTAKELAAVLIETNKTKDSELLAQDVAYELERRGKLAEARIVSATALGEALRQELKRFIQQTTKVDHVRLNEHVDKALIGGVYIETATAAWDRSIAKQLTDIREAF